jgi:hypothetical protein
MKVETLRGLIREGKKPMVRLTDCPWDDAFGQKGMLARVVSATDEPHDNLVRFTFDYNENREHNLSLDEPNWWIGCSGKRGTALEANHFDDPNNLTETVLFDPKDSVPVELVEAKSLLNDYLADNHIGSPLSYIEWLEAKVKELEEEITARNESDAGDSL